MRALQENRVIYILVTVVMSVFFWWMVSKEAILLVVGILWIVFWLLYCVWRYASVYQKEVMGKWGMLILWALAIWQLFFWIMSDQWSWWWIVLGGLASFCRAVYIPWEGIPWLRTISYQAKVCFLAIIWGIGVVIFLMPSTPWVVVYIAAVSMMLVTIFVGSLIKKKHLYLLRHDIVWWLLVGLLAILLGWVYL